jgi:hypothetical protein
LDIGDLVLRRIQKTGGMQKLSAPRRDPSSSLKSSANLHIATSGATAKEFITLRMWSSYVDSICRIVFIPVMYSTSLYFQLNKYYFQGVICCALRHAKFPHYCVALAFLALQQKVVVATILGMVAFEQLCRNVEFWLQIYLRDVATSWR